MIKGRVGDCLGSMNSPSKFIIGGLKSFMAVAGKINSFKRIFFSNILP